MEIMWNFSPACLCDHLDQLCGGALHGRAHRDS